MKLRPIAPWLLALLLAAPLDGCASGKIDPATTQAVVGKSGLVNVVSKSAGVEFEYPATWHPAKDDTVLTLLPEGESTIDRHVLVVDMPDLPPHIPGLIPMGLVEIGFVNDLKNRYQKVQVDQSIDRTVPGSAARQVCASGQNGGHDVKVVALLVVHGDRVFVIDSVSDSQNAVAARAAYETVVGSWKWTN